MKKFIAPIALTCFYCLFMSVNSSAQTEVNIVKSIPLTIDKINSPLNVNVGANNNGKGYTYKTQVVDYTIVQQNRDLSLMVNIEKASNDEAKNSYELFSITPYLSTDLNQGLRFLLVFRKPN